MNGAETLLRTLVNGGVDVCFTNPGTSEMHFVAAADRVPEMRCVLGLFEGVVSGAADGYARMADHPAATLLHLGPGLANALANFHNAMRARVPVVNLVGDQATYHRRYDAPLNSDIAAYAKPVSRWTRSVESPAEIPDAAREAIRSSMGPPPGIATLIVPADCSWLESVEPATDAVLVPGFRPVPEDTIKRVAAALNSREPAAFLMNGMALRERGLELAGRIAAAMGARVICDTFHTRLQRGAGRAVIERLPYFPEAAMAVLAGIRHLVLVGSRAPVSFFAYPDLPSELAPPDCTFHTLATPEQDAVGALARLADLLNAQKVEPAREARHSDKSAMPVGPLTAEAISAVLGALIPDHAVVVDESITGGMSIMEATAGALPHDWLVIPGGAIGGGPPLAVGAAVACPDRRVLCLEGDGSGMYTLQSLWTMARESLNVTTIIYANREYRILNVEYERMGAGAAGSKAASLFSLRNPDLDWVQLSRGMGVQAKRVDTADDFARTLKDFLAEPGPNLIEAVY